MFDRNGSKYRNLPPPEIQVMDFLLETDPKLAKFLFNNLFKQQTPKLQQRRKNQQMRGRPRGGARIQKMLRKGPRAT